MRPQGRGRVGRRPRSAMLHPPAPIPRHRRGAADQVEIGTGAFVVDQIRRFDQVAQCLSDDLHDSSGRFDERTVPERWIRLMLAITRWSSASQADPSSWSTSARRLWRKVGVEAALDRPIGVCRFREFGLEESQRNRIEVPHRLGPCARLPSSPPLPVGCHLPSFSRRGVRNRDESHQRGRQGPDC